MPAATTPAENHWLFPLAGKAPPSWPETERALEPEACGQCHGEKYEEWRSSLHSKSFSPGVVGQLLAYEKSDTLSCMRCHAPLAEQYYAFLEARERGEGHRRQAQGLAGHGNMCAGCHVRKRRYFGPPERDSGETGPTPAENPHGGVNRVGWFEDSAFCKTCHQFAMKYAVNGKPMLNTYREWLESPYPAQGVTCQSCHMPGRKHLWRGIHDPAMVAGGLDARFTAGTKGARFDLTSIGVGHAFPTYITPKVMMYAAALDGGGRPLPATALSYTIHRTARRTQGQWEELKDTRLMPGETATLTFAWPPSGRVRMWLEVDPDDDYADSFYDEVLAMLPEGSPEAALIHQAVAWGRGNRYRLFETDVERP